MSSLPRSARQHHRVTLSTLIIGRLGDLFGKEGMLIVTPVLFGARSLVSGLSGSVWPSPA